jgi:hypothetical protein
LNGASMNWEFLVLIDDPDIIKSLKYAVSSISRF